MLLICLPLGLLDVRRGVKSVRRSTTSDVIETLGGSLYNRTLPDSVLFFFKNEIRHLASKKSLLAPFTERELLDWAS